MKKNLIYSGMIAVMIMSATITTDAQNWVLGGNSPTKHDTLGNKTAFDLRFTTGNKIRMHIKNSTGRVGIGNNTNAPQARLDVWSGTTANDTIPVINALVKRTQASDIIGVQGTSQPNPGFGIGVQGNGNFIGVFGNGGNFGAVGISAGIGVDGEAAGADTTLANTGDLTGTQGLTALGHISVGAYGEAIGAAVNYGVFGASPDTAGTSPDYALVGVGDVFGWRYFIPSDRKLKNNIETVSGALDKISQLTASTYTFNHSKYPGMQLPGGKTIGFMADEIESVFPELIKNAPIPAGATRTKRGKVTYNTISDMKVVNYLGMVPVLAQAIKEQKAIVDAKDAQIADLNARLTALETKLSENSSAKLSSVNTIGASLEQNNPNPFNQSTEIRYSVPADYSSAKLIISSVDGKAVRTYTLSGKGQGQVTLNANELAVGSYTYSLNIDGKVVDSKSMVLTK